MSVSINPAHKIQSIFCHKSFHPFELVWISFRKKLWKSQAKTFNPPYKRLSTEWKKTIPYWKNGEHFTSQFRYACNFTSIDGYAVYDISPFGRYLYRVILVVQQFNCTVRPLQEISSHFLCKQIKFLFQETNRLQLVSHKNDLKGWHQNVIAFRWLHSGKQNQQLT